MGSQVLTAWDLIGFDPADYDDAQGVRIVGGRTVYEAVGNDGGNLVRLSRLDTHDGLHAVLRYVDPDTLMEVVPEDGSKTAYGTGFSEDESPYPSIHRPLEER